MAYVSCPECGMKISGKYGFLVDSCPRCRRRQGHRVPMEAHLGSFRPEHRFSPAAAAAGGTSGGRAAPAS